MNRNKEACHCHNVTYGMVEDAVKGGTITVEEVKKITKAGTGCGKCSDFLNCLVRDILEEPESNNE